MEEKYLPLSGITAIDFSTVVAAPSAARVLADLGARVIKVESKTGDTTRYQDAMPTLKPDSYSFTNTSTNKECMSVDIKTPGGKEGFLKLLERADVLITNGRYKSLIRAGLDYETLKDRFPRLVYAHFSGFGKTGNDVDLPGYDMSGFWARSGAMLDGHLDDSRRLFEPAYGMGDLFCAGYFTTGILAALMGREKTGHGTMVSTALLHAGVWANGRNIMPSQEAIGDVVPLPEKWNYNMFYRPYKCADGEWLCLAFNYLQHFEKACEVFGLEDILNDKRFRTQGALRYYEVAEELSSRLEKIIAGKPRDYWMEELRKRDLVYSPVLHGSEVTKDPQVLENGFVQKVAFENGTEAYIPTIPIQFSDYGILPVKPAARLGKDTEEVLKELGYTKEQISALTAEGSVR